MMPAQIARIPSRLLYEHGTARLRQWLHDRGLRMTLSPLGEERKRREDRRGQGV